MRGQRGRFRLSADRRAKHTPGQMNKTEQAFADLLKCNALIDSPYESPTWWDFEPLKFKLADRTFYTPDFIVTTTMGRVVAYEIKGYWEDDARVKIKCAAKAYPWIDFVACKHTKKDGWSFEKISKS